ncbi:MAG: aminotransferase class V-fold PLP-dependent enzyme, partial [Anaerolineales bacterium]|nr:aminotransferase class V-fold PLP-dependent enzyme [Anaerolineales bacterium]
DYQAWQRRLEWQPVQFLINDLAGYLENARAALGQFINAVPGDIAYIPNATFGLNVVARSLDLGPGDAVLTTNHEYGACDNIWRFLSQKRGFQTVSQPIPLPVTSADTIVEQFWQAVTPQTKVIFVSHITSSTALTLPVEMLCKRARAAGILTIVDGSHALGQIPLDMTALDADFYFSNAHKWLCAPKGSAFLYARHDKQPLIEPLVVGWGWGANRTLTFGSDYLDYMQWLGTNDLSAYLSVPSAIQFQQDHEWTAVRQRCHQLLQQAQQRLCEITGLASIYPDEAGFYHQMASIPLPQIDDLLALKHSLLADYRIEVPLVTWNGRHFIRISVQAYNNQADIDHLINALQELLSVHTKTG